MECDDISSSAKLIYASTTQLEVRLSYRRNRDLVLGAMSYHCIPVGYESTDDHGIYRDCDHALSGIVRNESVYIFFEIDI